MYDLSSRPERTRIAAQQTGDDRKLGQYLSIFQRKLQRLGSQSHPNRHFHYAGIIFRGYGTDCGERIELRLWCADPVERRSDSDHTYLSGTQLVAIVTENIPGTYPVTVVNPNPGSASSQRIKRTGFSRPGSHPATADRNQCPGQQHHHHYFGSNPYLGLMG